MRRTPLILLAVVVAGVLAWEFVPIQVMIWDGAFELKVHVVCHTDPPRAVSCEAFGHREYAEKIVARLLPTESQARSAIADPFGGQTLTVSVPVSGRRSPFGRELRWSQFQALVVIATYPDGHRVGKVVDIPDSRVSREVTVELP